LSAKLTKRLVYTKLYTHTHTHTQTHIMSARIILIKTFVHPLL